ncbi:MAG: iron ABC transporter permease [Polyangiaceae bacterium]|nr:iron ABC transporter permease [Polyangiaceae bacterium]
MARIHRARRRTALTLLGATLLVAVVIAIVTGPTSISIRHLLSIALDPSGTGLATDVPSSEHVIFWSLRLPRAVLCALVGAALGAGGAAAQGLFRNPLADPGLVGVSAGATLGAAICIVLAGPLLATQGPWLRAAALPIAAFVAGAVTTGLVVRLGGRADRSATATVLLAGVAINAFAGAMVGLLSHIASDAELRNFTFWTLGGMSGATWSKVALTTPFVAVSIAVLFRHARSLDVFALGEVDARVTGVDVTVLRRSVIGALALGVGAAVSAAGLVGFVGLIVPHLVRLWIGPKHGGLIPASALAGGALVVIADSLARTLAAPTELPVGLLTASVGAPFFLHLLRREVKRP